MLSSLRISCPHLEDGLIPIVLLCCNDNSERDVHGSLCSPSPLSFTLDFVLLCTVSFLPFFSRSGHFACEQISTKRLMSGTNAIGQLWERLLQEISAAWCSGAKIHHITCGCFVRKQFSHGQNPLLLEGQEPFLADSGPT
ncbi:hypothetical protein CRYUN_Cryun26dG0074200 [Craigia yunnanensis]